MTRRIGIDAGATLTKIAYEDRGHMHVKSYANQEMDQLIQWLQITNQSAFLSLTGGKSTYLQDASQQKSEQIEEFKAITAGTRHLLYEETGKIPDDFILVSIGTGTSIFRVIGDDYERLLGSGIGGGTFMGLGTLLTGKKDYHELIELAAEGNYKNSDLLVKDIYDTSAAPLSGNLTAANFGKAHINDVALADQLASLVRLIGETILLLSTQAAASQQVEKIVFTGSTLTGNEALKEVLSGFRDILPYEPVFLEKGAYAGAIGALYS
ncbi:type II pantothenate kinase [Virgibacillus sp. C22-A2]|uniref:Type II pantothenate kinase n=1 Tax=Virgibacillus tibetensis TaxID=3042313 RepID=A0ABU6KE11_9BACI|nr:type II pantothenate kinase [Virgibacillus sp. C22-A2]